MKEIRVDVVLQKLIEWRNEVLGKLKAGQSELLDVKLSIDASINWLECCQSNQLPLNPEVIRLPLPDNYEILGDYRILWDHETEDRHSWAEIGRALPRDLIVKYRR